MDPAHPGWAAFHAELKLHGRPYIPSPLEIAREANVEAVELLALGNAEGARDILLRSTERLNRAIEEADTRPSYGLNRSLRDGSPEILRGGRAT